MKIARLLILALIALPSFSHAQCVIDSNATSVITPPSNSIIDSSQKILILPPAQVGVSYNEQLQFKVPGDTMGTSIEYFRIDSIEGLPSAFSLFCKPDSCVFDGGGFGCLSINGTAAQPDSNKLTVYITLKTSLPVPASLPLITEYEYYFVVHGNGVGITEQSKARASVYPNPATDHFWIETNEAFREDVQISITDLTGSVVSRQYFDQLQGRTRLDLNGFNPGIYLYSVSTDGHQYTGRFTIRR